MIDDEPRKNGQEALPPPPPVPSASLESPPGAFGITPVPQDSLGKDTVSIVDTTPLYRLSPRQQILALKDVQIRVGEYVYYTIHELAILFYIPAYYLRFALRQDNVPGRIVNKVEIIDGESFHNWILAGSLLRYTPKIKRKTSLDADIELSKTFVENHRRLVE